MTLPQHEVIAHLVTVGKKEASVELCQVLPQ
nr:hypothetical protein [Sicyoidochytrium minutum DNA virus]